VKPQHDVAAYMSFVTTTILKIMWIKRSCCMLRVRAKHEHCAQDVIMLLMYPHTNRLFDILMRRILIPCK